MVREVKISFDEFDERCNPDLATGFDQLNDDNDDWDEEHDEEPLLEEWEDFEDPDIKNEAVAQPPPPSAATNNPNSKSKPQNRHLADADWMNDSAIDY